MSANNCELTVSLLRDSITSPAFNSPEITNDYP